MDGIVLINKEKGITSRDVVDKVCQKLNTRKVGHTGTLDPIATGLMVICVNKGCKLVELLTNHDKDYVAKVRLGIKTDTYDITGNILEENHDYELSKEHLLQVLNSFNGEYLQEVPIYSAIKVNGKKLYEYAREKKEVILPRHLVKISNMQLLDLDSDSFTFSVSVSKGTYIRSLINDISKKLNICMAMEELTRTRVGEYLLSDATSIDNLKVIPIIDALDIKKVEVDDDLFKKVSNGVKIKNIYGTSRVMFTRNNIPISIYISDNDIMKTYCVF